MLGCIYTDVHGRGAVVVNKRWNNYMANENLYPSNFEIYPRIKSVHPHVGSLGGDTLVTVTGSGFLENGLGGQVNVKIGDSDCAIESMTETQIICRTPQNTETPPSPVDVKMASFVDSSGFKLPNKGEYIHHRAKWVKTADWCKKLCAEDYACLGFSFRLDIDDGWDGCKLTSYMGGDADGEKLHIAEAVEDETVVSGWLPLASRSKETDCWTGRGELYEGQVTKTINDDECVAGTFCRNENPADEKYPMCIGKRTGKLSVCAILGCGSPKYAGNRGFRTQMSGYSVQHASNYYSVSPAQFWNPNEEFIHPVFNVNGGKKGMFFGMSDQKENYMTRVTNYFIAPYDGFYSFAAVVDDQAQVRIAHKDHVTGQYDHDIQISGAMSYGSYTSRSSEYGSRVYEMKKGEQLYMESMASEWPGGDWLQVGVAYHGKTLEESVWQSNRQKIHFPQDNYLYDHQRLWFKQVARTERVWITLKIRHDELEEDDLAKKGETYDRHKGVQFRLKQCGDSGR